MKETLQEKIIAVLPQKREFKNTSGNILGDSLYNLALSNAHSSLPKVMEVIRGELVEFLKEENGYKDEYVAPIKPKHGECCCCRVCGQFHDECVCTNNEIYQFLANLLK